MSAYNGGQEIEGESAVVKFVMMGERKRPIVLTAVTPSHQEMFDKHFLPSFSATIGQRFKLVKISVPFEGEGNFGSTSFNLYMKELMTRFRNYMAGHMGEVIIHMGCDMRFYDDFSGDILNAIKAFELVSINDNFGLGCCDFFAFRVTEKILEMYDWCIKNEKYFGNNELAFNAAIKELRINTLVLGQDFYTVGLSNGGNVWNPGDEVSPPLSMRLHHANFTVGAENKMALLDAVYAASSKP